jgi:hypothetical protein
MSIISKFEQKLLNAGFTNKVEYNSEQYGPAEFKSYFQYLLDRQLAGNEEIEPSPEELWTLMKRQVNFFERSLVKASDDFVKLENRIRNKDKEIEELIKELAGFQTKQ